MRLCRTQARTHPSWPIVRAYECDVWPFFLDGPDSSCSLKLFGLWDAAPGQEFCALALLPRVDCVAGRKPCFSAFWISSRANSCDAKRPRPSIRQPTRGTVRARPTWWGWLIFESVVGPHHRPGPQWVLAAPVPTTRLCEWAGVGACHLLGRPPHERRRARLMFSMAMCRCERGRVGARRCLRRRNPRPGDPATRPQQRFQHQPRSKRKSAAICRVSRRIGRSL
jgi:hypothetical protein